MKAPLRLTLAAFAGSASVLAFAPLYLAPVMWLSFGMLLWLQSRDTTPRAAALTGFVWGTAYFCANIHWIFISLHTFGGMPAWMAAGCTLLFALYLALFPALSGWLGHRFGGTQRLVLLALAFCATEYLRGWLFTGFPWASMGVSQLPATPLAGFAPLIGAWGVGLLLAVSLALALTRTRTAFAAVALVWLTGLGLTHVNWTTPSGPPVRVSLAQNNIAQDIKWDQDHFVDNLKTNLWMASRARGELIILPETAIPAFLNDLPDWYIQQLTALAGDRHLVTGVPTLGNSRPDEYYNAVIALTDRTQGEYRKQHLVPFGEFVPVPALFGWMYRFLDMPLSGFSRGADIQPPFVLGNTRLAANICYEDVFGREIIRALPDATMLANFSNLAWFDGSWAADQHAQMSQARALETGRYMLRSTNTGITAIIDHKGRMLARLAPNKKALLEGNAVNFTGSTPYSRIGDWGFALLLLTFFAGSKYLARSRNAVV
ncbi:apolipoprotein N-acyltransferase [Chitinibacteraceae bacterium HSL-7]